MTTKLKARYGAKSLEKRLGGMTFGSFLFSWRESLGTTQVAFAKELGISASNLCDIEKGRQLVSAKKAAEIAKLIGYSETVLVELAINEQLAADGLKLRVKTEVA
jgi:transcriptional regulator with XRE-family HTH domain